MSILDLTAVALGKKIRSGEVTSPEAAKAVLARMKALEPVLNCYVTIDEEQTLEQAARVQKAASPVPWPVCRWLLRIISVPKECGLPAVPGFWRILLLPTRQRRWRTLRKPEP